MKPIFTAAALALACMPAAKAQTLTLDLGKVPQAQQMQVCIYPANDHSPQATVNFTPGPKGRFTAPVPDLKPGVYQLYAQTSSAQTSAPVYLEPSMLKHPVKVQMVQHLPVVSLHDRANVNLQQQAARTLAAQSRICRDLASLDDASLLDAFSSFMAVADSLLAVRPAPEVAGFMRIWAYTTAADTYSLALHLGHRCDRPVTLRPSQFLPPAHTVLDSPAAAGFPNVSSIIMGALPSGTLGARIDSLYALYSTPAIRATVTDALLEDFITRHDYQNKYEEGELQLIALTERYALPTRWLDRYREHVSTITGVPFPADVRLQDTDGNPVEFAAFAGKWVYIDMWASWCGPCIREIPHLQALEHDLGEGNVVFVSISTDTDRDAWLRKCADLGLKGHQLWDSTGALGQALNIRGIPHFLLYDPRGCLYRYSATRPSSPDTARLLRSLK